MQKIKPTVSGMDIICAEQPAGATGIVIFGASGDLTVRKIIPGLFDLYRRDLMSGNFYILGCGRSQITDEQFQKTAAESIEDEDSDKIKSFAAKCHFLTGGYDDSALYEQLGMRIDKLNKLHKVDGNLIYYLSVPPPLYPVIVQKLHDADLSCRQDPQEKRKVRLIIEKPFGHDLDSARQLNSVIASCFDESQIYRIDHYLGKETVQNILIFRFANTIFEPVWNRNFIDNVQITIAESLGVGHRADYYDKSGALRDIFQNHMLQMLALVAMEPPASFEANCVRDEKAKLLESIRPLEIEPWSADIIKGQYTTGIIEGKSVPAYRDEEGVAPDSKTETFVAARLYIDNWRWKNVPFFVRTGKQLAAKNTEIAITFKQVPHSMFVEAGLDDLPANVLIMQIQPAEGISLQFQAKHPGSKLCVGTLDMNFHYSDIFGVKMPEAYSRLLLDAMLGDQTLFNRYDSVEIAWKLLDPVLKSWRDNPTDPDFYPAGAQSFAAADSLIESAGRKWRPIE
ncbi:MAG: glucose-6-phosphate dehydrogenase [Sedimentisphaerales bacterium]|nr:glucose-6-phosphate dehydrogenase [Sedimentisphaerales bacterium]